MIHEFFGGQIDLDPADGEMYELQAQGRWEWRKVDLMREILQPDMTFVDAGAYNGYFTLIAAHLVGKSGRVWAFEPDARSWLRLVGNVIENKYYQVLFPRAALADFTGKVDLYHREIPAGSTLLQRDAETVRVKAVRLDDVLLASRKVDMIKIDVEGAEVAVLRGAARILHQPELLTLLMDLHPELGVDLAEVETILKEAGFALFDIRSGNVPIDTIPPTLVELMARKS